MKIDYNRVGESADHLNYVGDRANDLINMLANIVVPEDEEGMIDLSGLNGSAGNIITEAHRVASLILTFVANAKALESQNNDIALSLGADFTASSVKGDGTFETNMTAEEFNKLLAEPFAYVNEAYDNMDKIEFENQVLSLKPEKYETMKAPTAKDFLDTVLLSAANVGGGVIKDIGATAQLLYNMTDEFARQMVYNATEDGQKLLQQEQQEQNAKMHQELDEIWNGDKNVFAKLLESAGTILSPAFEGKIMDFTNEKVDEMEAGAKLMYDGAFELDPTTKAVQELAGAMLSSAALGLGMEKAGLTAPIDVADIPIMIQESAYSAVAKLTGKTVVETMDDSGRVIGFSLASSVADDADSLAMTGARYLPTTLDAAADSAGTTLLPTVITDSDGAVVVGGRYLPMSADAVADAGEATKFLPATIAEGDNLVEVAAKYLPAKGNVVAHPGELAIIRNISSKESIVTGEVLNGAHYNVYSSGGQPMAMVDVEVTAMPDYAEIKNYAITGVGDEEATTTLKSVLRDVFDDQALDGLPTGPNKPSSNIENIIIRVSDEDAAVIANLEEARIYRSCRWCV